MDTGGYAGLNGGAVFQSNVDRLNVIPGTYLIEGTIDGMQSSDGGGRGQYAVTLYDGDTPLWPLNADGIKAMKFMTYKHESDDNFRQSNGSISFSTIQVFAPPIVEGEAVAVTALMVKVDEVVAGADIMARGTLKISRIGNADGSTGAFPL